MWRLSSTSPPSGARGSAASSLAAAFALALLTPSAAVAAPTSDALEISVDGVEFAASFAGSLFVEAPTLVPHGGADVTFSVRNAAESGGVLSLELRHATWTDLEFARALRVQATAGSVAGARRASAPGRAALPSSPGFRCAPARLCRFVSSFGSVIWRASPGRMRVPNSTWP